MPPTDDPDPDPYASASASASDQPRAVAAFAPFPSLPTMAAALAWLDPRVVVATLIRQQIDTEAAYLDDWLGIATRANDLTAQLVIQRRMADLARERQALDGADPDGLDAPHPPDDDDDDDDQPPTSGA